MNAYEIADELRKHGLNGDNHGLFNKRIQNMLRQQANELDKVVPQLVKANGLIENLRLRIAELEETINACYTVQKMQAEEVYKGNDRIAELEKLLEHSVGSDCREMRYIQEIENKDARIAELEKGEEVAGRFYWESVVDGHVMAVPSEGTPHYNKDDFPLYTTPQTKPLKRLNKQEIARYMFSQNTGQDIGQMLIEYFCDKNGLTLEYIED